MILLCVQVRFSPMFCAPTWNEEFELPDGSYSISDIQDDFEYIVKKDREKTVNSSIRI